eukprot:9495527-Pyramimonas_sp.AAC.1
MEGAWKGLDRRLYLEGGGDVCTDLAVLLAGWSVAHVLLNCQPGRGRGANGLFERANGLSEGARGLSEGARELSKGVNGL